MSAFCQPIKKHPGCSVCQCYPECRRDCPDSAKCYEALPVYWSAQYRAMKYAELVRIRKGNVIGSLIRKNCVYRTLIEEYKALPDYPVLYWWDVTNRVWKHAYKNTPLGVKG